MEKQLLPDLDKITYKEFFENSQLGRKLELSYRYAIACIEWVVIEVIGLFKFESIENK